VDVYNKRNLDVMIENDEISVEEAGFMHGYDEDF